MKNKKEIDWESIRILLLSIAFFAVCIILVGLAIEVRLG